MRTECRRSRYLSTLQQYIYRIYTYVCTSAVQYVRTVARRTYCTAVAIVRPRTVGTTVGTVGK